MKKVMCFGTFDGVQLGHLAYLKQAKKYGDYLIVVVARDRTVEKIKGRLPNLGEKARVKKIRLERIVNKAVLGQIKNKFAVIKKYLPDVICLGYDQEVDMKKLKANFFGKIVRAKSYHLEKYKSSKLRK